MIALGIALITKQDKLQICREPWLQRRVSGTLCRPHPCSPTRGLAKAHHPLIIGRKKTKRSELFYLVDGTLRAAIFLPRFTSCGLLRLKEY